ncbi:SAM-dependent methyltransferase [Actinorugispora endophytica]|uniref:SAM-dependent methyltransferase n=1 Tax=Actinorugispora endophytica TaxID=1605990 RepID=UPI001FB77375|nr:SAM-dependent methyltransferase [Actinorugispora endophytica]
MKRPVVTTWRRRYADFPAPVSETAERPLFDGAQVAGWLLSTGLGNADSDQLRAEIALHGIAARADRFGPRRLVELLGSLLCLRKLDERPLAGDGADGTGIGEERALWAAVLHRAERMDPDDEFVLRELRSAGEEAAPLARLAEDMVEAAYSERSAYEWLLAARSRLGLHTLAADAVAPELQSLLVQLADLPARIERGESVTVADPHARTGDLLAALIGGIENPEHITALAADPDEWMARVARRRLLLAGVDELALDVQTGRDLEERLADPDLIATRLPYRSGEDREVLTTLEDIERIADLLGPGCTALVLGPADALVDALPGTEEARLRSALLRGNIVEAVVTLPGGMLPYRPGYRTALWILTRDPVPAARGNVLLADIGAEPLTASVRDRLAEDVLLWRAEGFRAHDGHDPRYGRAVRVADLDRAFGGPLTPPAPPASQILARTVTERPALIGEAEAALERAAAQARSYDDAHGPYRADVLRRTGPRPRRTTLGALITQGRVTRLKGHRLDERHISGDGHYPVLGPPELTGRAPVGARRIDRLVLAAHYEHAALTEPGDIVYTLAPELGIRVGHDGLGVAAFPARVLRVNPDAERPIPPRVLAALLGATRGAGRSPSAVRPVRRIEDYPLPDLDPGDVERFDALLAEIEHRERMLRAQADALADARRMTVAGLADGTLTLEPR